MFNVAQVRDEINVPLEMQSKPELLGVSHQPEIIFGVILSPRIWYSCYYCSVTEKRMLWSYLMPRLTMRLEGPKAGARRAAS